MAKRKGTKGQTTIYRTLHIKQKIRLHESHLKPGVNPCAPEVHAALVAPVVLL
jgi:hypothetical protein